MSVQKQPTAKYIAYMSYIDETNNDYVPSQLRVLATICH